MKKILFGLCCLAFVGLSPALASYTTDKISCSKISDRNERSKCYTEAYEKKKNERASKHKSTEVTGKNPKIACRLEWDIRKRRQCENAADAQVEKTKQETKKSIISPEKTIKKKSVEQEIFLKVIPCEQKKTRTEKLLCYHNFHKEQEEKKKQASAPKPVYVSPTLRLIKCKSMTDRNNRAQCYADLRQTEREEKEQKWENTLENFTDLAGHDECGAIANIIDRARCFHNLDKTEQRIITEQERQAQ